MNPSFFQRFSGRAKRLSAGLSRWQRIVLTANGLLLIYSFFAFLSIHIPPSRFWPAGFATLSIPVLLAMHVLLVAWWLRKRPRRWAWLSLAALAMALPLLERTFAWHWQPPKPRFQSFKVLSFNTQLFNAHDYFNAGDKTKSKSAIEWLRNDDSDIKCLQEFYDQDGSRDFNSISKIAQTGGYNYYITPLFHGNRNWKGFYGVAIFSKFPIVNTGDIIFDRNTLNKGIFVDVKINADTVRVFSVHLLSMSIRAEQLAVGGNYQQTKSSYVGVLRRLKKGFVTHSRQVTTLDRYVRNSPHPVIVCGDFNSMPYSFTYQKMRKRLRNAFEDAGSGFGFTYNSRAFFFLRIDNQFYDSRLQVHDFRIHREVNFSDHFPISATYSAGQAQNAE